MKKNATSPRKTGHNAASKNGQRTLPHMREQLAIAIEALAALGTIIRPVRA